MDILKLSPNVLNIKYRKALKENWIEILSLTFVIAFYIFVLYGITKNNDAEWWYYLFPIVFITPWLYLLPVMIFRQQTIVLDKDQQFVRESYKVLFYKKVTQYAFSEIKLVKANSMFISGSGTKWSHSTTRYYLTVKTHSRQKITLLPLLKSHLKANDAAKELANFIGCRVITHSPRVRTLF